MDAESIEQGVSAGGEPHWPSRVDWRSVTVREPSSLPRRRRCAIFRSAQHEELTDGLAIDRQQRAAGHTA